MTNSAGPGKEVERAVAFILATGHALVGVTGIVAPRFLMWFWAGLDPEAKHVRLSGVVVGVRDVALGAGTMKALRRGEVGSVWSRLMALSDTVDAVGTLLFFRHTPWWRRAFIVATVGASAIAGRWLNGPANGGPYSSGPTA